MTLPERDVITKGPDRGRRRSVWRPVIVFGLVIAVVVTLVRAQHPGNRGASATSSPSPPSPPSSPAPTARPAATAPPAADTIVARVPLSVAGFDPPGVALGGGAIWVADWGARRLLKVSTATNKIVARRDLGRVYGGATSIAYGAGSVWIATDPGGTVLRIDPRTLRTTARVRYGGTFETLLAFGAGRLWVMACCGADDSTAILTRIDPRTNRAVQAHMFGGDRGSVLLAGDDGVWTDSPFPKLARRDPHTLAVVQQVPGGRSGGPAVLDGGELWTVSGDARLLRIDGATGVRVTGPEGSGEGVETIGAGPDGIFAVTNDGRLLRIDERTLRPLQAGVVVNPPVPQWSRLLSGESEGLWLATRGELVRLDPDRLPQVSGT
jgi:sugar lactone lactonase YvrE